MSENATDDRPQPPTRGDFSHFETIETRWADNDMYGHINNIAYYGYFDSAINRMMIQNGAFHPLQSEAIGLVVQTGCHYFSPTSFPDILEIGVATERVGRSSVRYRLGVFRQGDDRASALGHFVHVYVDRKERRPVPIPEAALRIVLRLQAGRVA
jgi:acyl-CoA thioester hydrolase